MRIVIAGAGYAGIELAKNLSCENFDVEIIDSDFRKLETLRNYDLLAIEEDPLKIETLKKSGIKAADMFIALMPEDSDNIILAILAKELGAKTTVARISRDVYFTPDCIEMLKRKGIDHIVYPEMLAVKEIESALHHPWSRHWSELCDGILIVAAGVIKPESELYNLVLKDFPYHSKYHISAVTRGRTTIIPNGDTRLLEGDIAYISTIYDYRKGIYKLFGCRDSEIKKIMIVGGSRVGEMSARHLCSDYKITLVEKDSLRAQLLAESMPKKIVVANGDGRSIEFLDSESISDYDAYIAMTESSEGNIIGCQIAREMGVEKTVVKTTSTDLVTEAEKLGINTVINKNLLCIGRIRQILLDSCEESCMSLAGANVMVISVAKDSPVTKKAIKNLSLPSGVTIAGLVRDGVGIMVNGETRIIDGDRVILFHLQGAMIKINKLFKTTIS